MAGDLGTITLGKFTDFVTATYVNTPGSWDASVNQTFTYALGGWPIRLPSDRTAWKTVSGTVYDSTGTPVARTVRAVRRSTGELLAETVSDASTGAYSLRVPDTSEVQVLCLDDSAGVLENDLVLRTIPA